MVKNPENDVKDNSKKRPDVKKKDTSQGKKNDKEVIKLKEEISQKENEIKEVNDKYLRVLAEYDNYKKRTVKEKETIYSDAVADTLKEFLPVLDNYERALSSFSDDDKETEFFKGIEMIYNQMKESFVKIGVSEISSVGEQFNPDYHNAVMHIDDENVSDNTVVEEFQKGYIYRDKVIRYSMVKVAN